MRGNRKSRVGSVQYVQPWLPCVICFTAVGFRLVYLFVLSVNNRLLVLMFTCRWHVAHMIHDSVNLLYKPLKLSIIDLYEQPMLVVVMATHGHLSLKQLQQRDC